MECPSRWSPDDGQLASTTNWLWRILAAFQSTGGSGRGNGRLSTMVGALSPADQQALLAGVMGLRSRLVVADPRDLLVRMAQLSARHRLNLLSGEALASAESLGATVWVRTNNPKLHSAAKVEGIDYQIWR